MLLHFPTQDPGCWWELQLGAETWASARKTQGDSSKGLECGLGSKWGHTQDRAPVTTGVPLSTWERRSMGPPQQPHCQILAACGSRFKDSVKFVDKHTQRSGEIWADYQESQYGHREATPGGYSLGRFRAQDLARTSEGMDWLSTGSGFISGGFSCRWICELTNLRDLWVNYQTPKQRWPLRAVTATMNCVGGTWGGRQHQIPTHLTQILQKKAE